MSQHRSQRPELEPLENRDTPALSPFLSNGVLFLVGTARADQATISARGDAVVVTQAGGRESTFARADVRGIIFLGFAGRDTFVNQTSVNAVAFGGLGRDTLQAGSGQDTLVGGPGRDELIGDGDDRLRANFGLTSRALSAGPGALSRGLTTDPVLVQGLNTLQRTGLGTTSLNGGFGFGLAGGLATVNAFNGVTNPLIGFNANATALASLSAGTFPLTATTALRSPLLGLTSDPFLGTLGTTLPTATLFNVPQVSPGDSFVNTGVTTTTLEPITRLDGFT